ncbi:polyprenyl diphosphate synthase [Pseudomarimonas arenosa]|uniref:Ditrans,polycis-undecaprenyl-diphosphate synthase ((2E,6E)-farnesyl-diphosphate specific) n=1 Tax=Pseudomarimonas arenosa TaxID=2774145 RepID=A0AAW3ZST3_9GAMM|nr:polyprenyl diphosphate synthase [Pseudomarimonas arenosa]MBD8527231.1 di-trans,poly-cis-decaprenylcistransferase [Pseudomarimonas arenosa]
MPPRHIAIVMDGNGRWAKARHRPRTIGHRAGARAVNRCIDWCLDRGIEALTLFAFSSENWQRPQDEVSALMQLFMRALDREVEELARRGVRLRFIGERQAFSDPIQQRMQRAEQHTASGTHLQLNIAASYGGRWDIVQACRRLAAQVANGELQVAHIDEPRLSQAMCLADLPPPDLFIRTGGEQRISNFLLWQMAYTELYFTDAFWPDMDAAELDRAMHWFNTRERRFGLISEQLKAGAAS